MRVSVILLTLLPLSQGCLAMRSDPPPCATCPQTLGNNNLVDGHCAVHRTCVSCTSTEVVYSRVGECLHASVSCPNHPSSPRIRLLKTDNTYIDIEYESKLSDLACTGVTWKYTYKEEVITDIKKAICFGTADGFQESPINLTTSSAVYSPLYDATQFTVDYGEDIVQNIKLHRDARGFHVNMKQGAVAYFTASHLDARYRLVEYHGHWNKDGMKGSEHSLNGEFYPADFREEANFLMTGSFGFNTSIAEQLIVFHFVHIRDDFATLEEAVGQYGVAVIGILAKISPVDNPRLNPLIQSIAKCANVNPVEDCIVDKDTDPALFQQDPSMLFPMDHNYFSYTGSLTTGQYQKCVAWNVLTKPIDISLDQLKILGSLTTNNYRDVVSIDTGTTVYTSEVKKNNRRPIKEEEEETREKESETHSHSHEVAQSFVQNEEEDEGIEKGIEMSQDELEFFRRLIKKYDRKKSELRSKLLEWTT